jgi:BirA family biotin operon repressor/biotin-[acetyl-CoA-carboxylase] ligase
VKDSLSPASITRNLETRFMGQRVIYYPSLASTNEVAKDETRRGAVEGTVVVTEEQTAGKGRLKRTWLSPQGSLALSLILYPSVAHLPSLIMLASLAVVHSIEMASGLKPRVKWPNDVLLSGKKVCGILIESEVRGSSVGYAVIGIGVNVNLRISHFPEIMPVATSLSDELGRGVSRLDLIRKLLVEMERLYLSLLAGGPVYEEWRDSLITLGKEVRTESSKAVYQGVAESVTRDGGLLLRQSDGSLHKIVAGDVTLHHRI